MTSPITSPVSCTSRDDMGAMLVTAYADLNLPTALARWARLRPDDIAFTLVDYAEDQAGVTETLTWAQLHNRTRNVAAELRTFGSPGERAVICAPQDLEYVVGFLGAIEAGLIAVPLSVPQFGDHDERISSVLADASPAVVLTTSAASGGMSRYLQQSGRSVPALIELDSLDLDGPADFLGTTPRAGTAYLQYTSGSTREPAGVQISHRNLAANFEQTMRCYYPDTGNMAPPGTTMVTWLPFYHDMGLFIGLCSPILAGLHSVVFNPLSFLMRPARWVRQIGTHSRVFTPAPNFAFELAIRRTSDNDVAGLDLSDVTHIISGAERVQPATLDRFAERFGPLGLRPEAVRPSYGLAEATVFVAARSGGAAAHVVPFDSEKLAAGIAKPCTAGSGLGLVSYGEPASPAVRVVDPETCTENPAGTVGEIWVQGDNVAVGYWNKPDETERTFGGRLVATPADTPGGRWLRTGDLGVISEGELFIAGRIKDLIIIDGRNHYPDDIEATVREITNGRVAAISVAREQREMLVIIAEFMPAAMSLADAAEEITAVKNAVNAAISTVHGIRVSDLVLISPASLPLTTSGKTKRSECARRYSDGGFIQVDEQLR